MEFLQAVEEAEQRGISHADFVRIWEQEMKLKQQKEESRILELKLACGNTQDSTQSKSIKDQVKSLLQNHLKELRQEISELKNNLFRQSDLQFQEMSKRFESQAAVTAMVIRNELDNVLSQYGARANNPFTQDVPYAYSGFQQPLPGRSDFQRLDTFHQQKQRQDKAPSSSRHRDDYSDSEVDGEYLFPSEDGAVLSVRDVDKLIINNMVTESPVYILSECPSKVQLSIWFSQTGKISAQMSVFGDCSLKSCRIFTVTGHIENRSSGSYSPLFEGTSMPLRKLRPFKKMLVNTSVCLKTGSGSYEDVTFDELDRRNFVIDNSLIIKWFVTSEVVDTE